MVSFFHLLLPVPVRGRGRANCPRAVGFSGGRIGHVRQIHTRVESEIRLRYANIHTDFLPRDGLKLSEENVVELAKDRFLAIAIGVAVSFFTSVVVFPAWAGADLHKLSALNLEKLAGFLQNCEELLEGKKSTPEGHKSVLNSKFTEDSLSNFARWEPPHCRFRFRHPWDQYQKIGSQSRR